MLNNLPNKLQSRPSVSLAELSRHFRQPETVIQGLLWHWVGKAHLPLALTLAGNVSVNLNGIAGKKSNGL